MESALRKNRACSFVNAAIALPILLVVYIFLSVHTAYSVENEGAYSMGVRD